MKKTLRIGLTGGIGSGKSTACAIFTGMDVTVIDADQIAHDLSASGQPAFQAIVGLFGKNVVRPDGELDRGQIRKIIFEEVAARHKLESILHPLIYNEINSQVSRLNDAYCIICIPLLIETGAAKRVDRILVIDAPVEQQIERACTRDGISREMVISIIKAQATREQRLEIADDIIFNDGDVVSLKQQIHELNEKYKVITDRRTDSISGHP